MELFMLQVRIPEGGCQWAMWRLNLLYDLALEVIKQHLGLIWLVKSLSSRFCLKRMEYKSDLSTKRVWKTTLSEDHVAWLSWERTIFHIVPPNPHGLLKIYLAHFFHWEVKYHMQAYFSLEYGNHKDNTMSCLIPSLLPFYTCKIWATQSTEIQTEVSQREKNKYRTLMHICGI